MSEKVWKDAAYETLVKVALEKEEFTPDDIWDSGIQKPQDARALGAVMRRAKNKGLIEKTGRSQPTRQPESHATDVTIWKSNIFKG